MILLYLLVLVALILLAGVVVRRTFRRPWRTHAREKWDCAGSVADAVLLISTSATNRRGWIVESSGDGPVKIRCRMTWATWRKEIIAEATATEALRTHALHQEVDMNRSGISLAPPRRVNRTRLRAYAGQSRTARPNP